MNITELQEELKNYYNINISIDEINNLINNLKLIMNDSIDIDIDNDFILFYIIFKYHPSIINQKTHEYINKYLNLKLNKDKNTNKYNNSNTESELELNKDTNKYNNSNTESELNTNSNTKSESNTESKLSIKPKPISKEYLIIAFQAFNNLALNCNTYEIFCQKIN